MKDGAGANPLEHKLLAASPVKEGPDGPVGGKDGVAFSPASAEGRKSDPISKEKVDATRIGVRGSTGRDKGLIPGGSGEQEEIVEEARMDPREITTELGVEVRYADVPRSGPESLHTPAAPVEYPKEATAAEGTAEGPA